MQPVHNISECNDHLHHLKEPLVHANVGLDHHAQLVVE